MGNVWENRMLKSLFIATCPVRHVSLPSYLPVGNVVVCCCLPAYSAKAVVLACADCSTIALPKPPPTASVHLRQG